MARRKHSATSSRTRPAPGSRSLTRREANSGSLERSRTAHRRKKTSAAGPVPEARRGEAPEVLAPVEIRQGQALDGALPSSLGLERHASAARSGRAVLEERVNSHNETGPVLTSGDVDADWVAAYSVGDETPGGDNPTPDQDVVDEIGKALGVEYSEEEELDGDRVVERDRHRWELDPASSEDYQERLKAVPKPRTEGKGREAGDKQGG
jgi:hypothetical protein